VFDPSLKQYLLQFLRFFFSPSQKCFPLFRPPARSFISPLFVLEVFLRFISGCAQIEASSSFAKPSTSDLVNG